MENQVQKFIKSLKGKNSRTLKVQKNIFFSFGLKGIGILISFVLVPLTINYLNTSEYGVWLTLSSLMTWISYFDIGLGNGLRNQLTKALSLNDYKLGQIYVSTTFAILSVIVVLFISIFIVVNPFLDWNKLLNTNSLIGGDLGTVVLIVFVFFCLQFVFKTVGTILVADQKPAYNDLIGIVGNFLSLVIIYFLTKFSNGSLTYVAITFSSTPLFVFVFSYFILFFGKYKALRPKFSAIDIKYTKDLIGIGLQFFIIQIAVCVIAYTSTNIIIAQLFDPDSVTIYNIAFKFFFSLSMTYLIIITPFWSAATEAYTKKDFLWIKSSIMKLLYVYLGSLILLIIMLLVSNWFYVIWVGRAIKVPFTLSIMVALYVALYNWSTTFIFFINGIGKIRLQLYVTLIIAVFYIPFSVYLGRLFQLNGVVLASVIALIPLSILMPIQLIKVMNNKSTGIWNK